MSYHKPVLLEESIEGLNINKHGVYVDVTFGGGGHSKSILKQLGDKGRLIAFDRDSDAQRNILDDPRLIFIHGNFRYLYKFLRLNNISNVDGVLADLGVSSFQFDTADRGFSYRFDADLDMRMSKDNELDAAVILNTYSEKELWYLFSDYGEVKNSRSLAKAIIEYRANQPFQRSSDFLLMLRPLIRGNKIKYLSQVFQALRIEVNDEINALKDFLQDALKVLKPAGRLSIISYHSLEDRLVKNFFKAGNFKGKIVQDDFGNVIKPFKAINRKVILPAEEEIKINSRARSAKLRVAEKL
ncbi:MAG: 16S rRNA (cytosine(1402)-N(4))-methyltransferase RsmH [Bacteroidota bacterium]